MNSYSQLRINWGDICRNPLVDNIISEPCSSLTTNNGYTLTAEGERVVACLAGGGLLMLIDPTGQALEYAQSLQSTFGCGGNGGGSSYDDNFKSPPKNPPPNALEKFEKFYGHPP